MAMYNRYIPNGATYTRVVEDEAPATAPLAGEPEVPKATKKGLSSILKGLKLEGLDTGDILLLLILLFLFLEGDDIELIITLGLLLLLGLE